MSGKFLLYSELVLIILLFYFGSLSQILENAILSIIFAVGVILALYAFYNMKLETFSIFPEPKKSAKHVKEGAYKYIRHPMYTGTALIGLSLLFSRPIFPSAIIYILLLYVLDQKATLEENLLTKLHVTYSEYQKNTKKFIPYLY